VSDTRQMRNKPDSSRPARRGRSFFLQAATAETSAPLCQMGQFHRTAPDVGFPTRKRVDGRAGKRGPTRSSRRADEAVDVARYIIDMTARLEAMAIASGLDRLAYFLGMANAESEILVRATEVIEAERGEEEP
jgi:hypothetical protein